MPTSYSTNLKLSLMATGENDGTWGTITNTNLGTLLEQAIVSLANVAMSDATTTITISDGATSEARCYVLNLTGALTAARNLVVPTINKPYVVKNSTSGGFAVTVKTTAGTGISVPNGKTKPLFTDGTNVVDLFDTVSALTLTGNATLQGTLAVTGISNLTGNVTINPGNLNVSGQTVLAATTISSTLDIGGNVTAGVMLLDTLFQMNDGGGNIVTIDPGAIVATGTVSANDGVDSVTIAGDGNALATGTIEAAAFVTTSDYRMKENIEEYEDAWGAVSALKVKRFTMRGKEKIGFLAHEAAEVVPEMVKGEKDGEIMQGIEPMVAVGVLTRALQQAMIKIERLEARVG